MPVTGRIEIVGRSTAQQVADGLANLILEGEMVPGERLSEAGIARSLGLSRNTVREAVRLLEKSGLVRYHFNRGLAVWDPTDADVVDVFKARSYFERMAAAAITPDTDLSAVRAAHRSYGDALASRDAQTIVEKDLAIHQALVGLLQSERIDKFYGELINELRYLLVILSLERHEYEDTEALAAEHQRLVDGFESRDPAVAEAAVTALLDENLELVRSVIAGRHEKSSSRVGRSG
jgi:DNA-binding GntR family transcriptional regulator